MSRVIASFVGIFVVAVACLTGGCHMGMTQHFPPAAKQMPEAQLAVIVPEYSAFFGGRFGTGCPIDDRVGEPILMTKGMLGPDGLYRGVGLLAAIRSLDSNTASPTRISALQPFSLAPGKYEIEVYWQYKEARLIGHPKVFDGRVTLQLDAEAGKTYVLAGTVTKAPTGVTAAFSFIPK